MLKKILKRLFQRESILFVTQNELNREFWVKNQLQNLSKGLKILDAGAGEMQYKKYCSHLIYTSQDFAQYDPSNLDVGLQVNNWNYGQLDLICDIAKIPVEDNCFDVILCTEVFEHIIHPVEALNEFNRVLRPGGILLLTAPFCSLTHFAPYHFYTGFSKYFYIEKMKSLNFDIIELQSNGNYFDYILQELNRLNSVSKKYANNVSLNKSEISALNKIKEKLRLLSSLDSGSNDLLCFGFHLKAIKK